MLKKTMLFLTIFALVPLATAKKGSNGKKGGNGGKNSGSVQLIATLRDAIGDNLLSDSFGSYQAGVDEVQTVEWDSKGHFVLNISNSARHTTLRTFQLWLDDCLDFECEVPNEVPEPNPVYGIRTGAVDFNGLQVGEGTTVDMSFGFPCTTTQGEAGNCNLRWNGETCGGGPTELVTVTRTANGWKISTDGSDGAACGRFIRNPKNQRTLGRFGIPFSISLEPVP